MYDQCRIKFIVSSDLGGWGGHLLVAFLQFCERASKFKFQQVRVHSVLICRCVLVLCSCAGVPEVI